MSEAKIQPKIITNEDGTAMEEEDPDSSGLPPPLAIPRRVIIKFKVGQ